MSAFAASVRHSIQNRDLFALFSVIGGSLFLALLTQFSIPLWFTPIPMTLQTLGVMLIGASLGSKKGALAIIAYLIEGAIGLPVFAGGASGLNAISGLTGGYLIGFILAAFLVGFCFERGWKKRFSLTLLAFVLASATILALGSLWLGLFVGIAQAVTWGFTPFIMGTILQITAALALIPSIQKIFK